MEINKIREMSTPELEKEVLEKSWKTNREHVENLKHLKQS